MPITIDETDKKILRHLQKDSDISNADLADKVGLSAAPCWRRVKRLEEKGIIKRHVAIHRSRQPWSRNSSFHYRKDICSSSTWFGRF